MKGAVVCTVAYGALKLYWALGGEFLLRQAPLPPDAIRSALAHSPGAALGHWLSVGAAAVGVVVLLRRWAWICAVLRPAPGRR